MKKKIGKIVFCILICTIVFFSGMKAYRDVYKKGFHDGVKFTLDELLIISEQQEYGYGSISGI